MSTTILVLSFLMLSLSAEAEEMMDPFALIRQTLKYWHRVYKMYEQEVALGYCWAEYFLRVEENTRNASMSQNSEFNGDERKRYDFISMDSGREQVRNRRSYGISYSTEASRTLNVVKAKLEPIDRDIRTDYAWGSIDSRKQRSSSSRQPDNHETLLFPRGNKTILENDVPRNLRSEFKENRTVDDWMLAESMDRSRKFLSPEMGQGFSGSSPRYSFLFQFSRWKRLNTFEASLPPVERIVDFEQDDTGDRLKVNRNEDDPPRGRQLDSSNLESQRVAQELSRFQENLRGKRETNDRIRSFVWPSSKIGEQESSMCSLDSRNRQRNQLFDDYVRRSASTFGSRRTNVHSINARSNIRALPVIPGGIANVPEPFITINPRALPRNPSFDEKKKRGNDWVDENSSKQSPSVADDRYRSSWHDFLVEKSERGWNAAVRRPTGQPSLPCINYSGFMGDCDGWMRGTSRNLRSNRSSWTEYQGRRPLSNPVEPRGSARSFGTFFRARDAVMGFLRTLGFFVQVGRELMDYVESNAALACTKDYLWGKAVQWIDS